MSKENLKLWDSVQKTDPHFTKKFSRGGGFKGTATNAVYLIRKATEQWGPMGGRWGVRIVNEQMMQGAPFLNDQGQPIAVTMIHKLQIDLFYPAADGKEGSLPAFGQTTFVGRDGRGIFTDEEAPKKSLTDAVSKALSWLGFSADIHMGMYDDNKYVADITNEFNQPAAPTQPVNVTPKQKTRDEVLTILNTAAKQGSKSVRDAYKALSLPERNLCTQEDVDNIKMRAEANDAAAVA